MDACRPWSSCASQLIRYKSATLAANDFMVFMLYANGKAASYCSNVQNPSSIDQLRLPLFSLYFQTSSERLQERTYDEPYRARFRLGDLKS
jgi:hypothetical protein